MPDLSFLPFICLVLPALCSIPALVQIARRFLGTRSRNTYSHDSLYQDEDGVSEDGARRIGAGKLLQVLILVCSIAGLLLSVGVFVDGALQEGHGKSLEPEVICGIWV